MNREDIIRMAQEAYGDHLLKSVQDFAAFAYDKGVEAENEACLKIAENELNNTKILTGYVQTSSAARNIVDGIRARGKKIA